MKQCNGRVALVTGASRGIGRAIAKRLAAEGAAVVLNAPVMGEESGQKGTLAAAVLEIQAAGGNAVGIACDLMDPVARGQLIAKAGECFGPIDILVNNAGCGFMKPGSESTGDEMRKMFELNVIAPVDLAQQCLPHMKKTGEGWILNIGSGSHEQSLPPYPHGMPKESGWMVTAYGSSKAALDRFTVGLAHEVQEFGVFVNCMKPTAIVMTSAADFVRHIARANPGMIEPVEMMAEGALEFCTGRHVGRVCSSREIVHYAARKVRSLDGTQVLGDAFLLGNPEEIVAA